MDFTRNLADELCAVTYATLPAATVEHSKMAIASSLAASAVAQRSQPVSIVRDLITRRAGAPQSLVWFTGGVRAAAPDAVRLNHMAADESMADDSALLNGSHLGSAVSAAGLALADFTGASGRQVLTAVATGYEAAIRIGRAEESLRAERGAHVSGLNAFGCAVTAAKILDSDPEAMAHAIVLAATGAGGVDRVSTNNARAYQAGQSAAIGVEAALAARHGYRASTSVMDRYLNLIRFDGTPTGRSLSPGAPGESWAIDTELIVKLRPGAFLFGSAVEAALRLVTGNRLDAANIEQVTVRGHRFLPETGASPPLPAGSLAYYVASAMVRQDFTWDHFADGHLDGPAIEDLRERVHIEPTSAQDAPGTWGWAAEVTAATRDGRTFQATVDLPPGSVVAGLDWAAIEAKALHLMSGAGLGEEAIRRILMEVGRLDSAPDTAPLMAALSEDSCAAAARVL